MCVCVYIYICVCVCACVCVLKMIFDLFKKKLNLHLLHISISGDWTVALNFSDSGETVR